MKNSIINKILLSLTTILIIFSLNFAMIHTMPGNPLIYLVGHEEYYYLLENNPKRLEDIKIRYGLNDDIKTRYIKYFENAIKLDFGISHYNHKPVFNNVMNAIGWTLLLSLPVWIIGAFLGAVLGGYAGYNKNSFFDKISTFSFLVIYTMPANCLGILLLMLFSYNLKLLPINGMVDYGVKGIDKVLSILKHMTLPFLTLVLYRLTGNFFLMKSSVSQIKDEDYILTAKSKGFPENYILKKHILKNALLPYLTSFFVQFGAILSGSMIVEVVFGWKGMGTLMYKAVSTRDFPTAQFCFLISAIMVVFANLLSDVVNIIIDPRIKEVISE